MKPSTWPTVAAISGVAALGVVVIDADTVVKGPLVAWFLLVCPGMTVVNLLDITEPILRFAATFGISIALGVVVAEALLYLGWWSPVLGLGILCGLTVAGALLSAVTVRHSSTAVDRP